MRCAILITLCFAAAFHSCLASTTDPPQTTESSTITTTPDPSTTTTNASTTTTTTEKTTTTSQDNTTTTITSSTTAKTTPVPSTPKPTDPVPTSDPNHEPEQNVFNVSDNNLKRYCLLTKMGVRMTFSYQNTNKTMDEIMYDIGKDAKQGEASTCGANWTSDEILEVNFNKDWKMVTTFKYNVTSKEFYISKIQVTFSVSDALFPDTTATPKSYVATLDNVTLFSTSNSSSFQCVSDNPLSDFTIEGLNKTVFSMNLTTSNLHVQAFRPQNNTDYAMSLPCPADTEVSNIVPIAVGAALAGLVVIVLVAYLIGRRKNRRGYESV